MSSILSLPSTPPAVDPAAAAPDPQAQLQSYSAPGLGVANLTRNPQLPQHPLGAYTDSQYEAEVAQLKFEIGQRYNDVLQQLGYQDDNGNFVPGQVETDANRQKSELARNFQLADEQTTQQAQQQGTLFSGLRGTAQARAEFPFANALGQIGVDTPKKLSDLYGQAGGLVNEFTIRHNLLLASAAQRAAANLANNSAAGSNVTGASGGDYGGGGAGATLADGSPVPAENPIPAPAAATMPSPTANANMGGIPQIVQPDGSLGQPVLEHAPGTLDVNYYNPQPALPPPDSVVGNSAYGGQYTTPLDPYSLGQAAAARAAQQQRAGTNFRMV